MKSANYLKMAAIPAFLALKGSGDSSGSKLQLGVNYLKLQEEPVQNTSFCAPPTLYAVSTSCMTEKFPENERWITIKPFQSAATSILFSVMDIQHDDTDRIVILVYSTQKTPSPAILTPLSKIKLELDLNFIEIIGIYNAPAQAMTAQPQTRIGVANPAPKNRFGFIVNLSNQTVPNLMRNGNTTIYVQAALLRKSDFLAGSFDGMILSEVDTLHFVEGDCPKGTDLEPLCSPIVQANDQGELYFPQH